MAIDLTNSEKSTFFRFLSLYLGSSFILTLFIAFLYYQNEKTLYYDLTKSNMQNIVAKVSNEIIFAHMRGLKFDKDKYLNSDEYQISFYDESRKKLFGTLTYLVNFDKNITFDNENLILVDNSTVGHLGIEYIAIKDNSLSKILEKLAFDIILIFLIIYTLISILAYYLAKLFLKPIKDERERINNFIKDTTHELNTPISAILMSTENETISEKQAQRIRLSAKRVSEIYKDLTYIFLQENQTNKEIRALFLNEIIVQQLEYFQPLYNKKKIEIVLDLEEIIYSINKDDFIRIFNNLISNAIKYNKINGKIEIILKDNSLIISDTGIGIEENKLKDIYKRYYRATKEQGGFGLGLNIVNYICNIYNIKISVNSKIDEGTTFHLKF